MAAHKVFTRRLGISEAEADSFCHFDAIDPGGEDATRIARTLASRIEATDVERAEILAAGNAQRG